MPNLGRLLLARREAAVGEEREEDRDEAASDRESDISVLKGSPYSPELPAQGQETKEAQESDGQDRECVEVGRIEDVVANGSPATAIARNRK